MIFLPFHNEEHACWPDADFYESCQRTALRNIIHWLSAGCVGGGTCNLRFTPLWLQGHNLSVQINSTMACLDFHMPDRWRIFVCVSRKPQLPVEMFYEVNSLMLDVFRTFHPLLPWALDQKHTLHYYTNAVANSWPMQHKGGVLLYTQYALINHYLLHQTFKTRNQRCTLWYFFKKCIVLFCKDALLKN